MASDEAEAYRAVRIMTELVETIKRLVAVTEGLMRRVERLEADLSKEQSDGI